MTRTRLKVMSGDRTHVCKSYVGLNTILKEDSIIAIDEWKDGKWQEVACHQLKKDEIIKIKSNTMSYLP